MSFAASPGRPAWAQIDLGAVRHNAAALGALAAPARLCAVVKAGGYGHGIVPVSQAALEGGAIWLAVAMVEEGADLREAGIEAPVLLLSEPPHASMADVVELGLTPTLYTQAGVEAAAKAVAHKGAPPLAVHIKVDTGMHRVGAAPADAFAVALAVAERPELRLGGLWTHFAKADEPGDPFTAHQHAAFLRLVDDLAAAGLRPPLLHACNSAAAIAHPDARHDLVRCGITMYGVNPGPAIDGLVALRPALSLRAQVSYVKEVTAGEGVSYGLRRRFDRRTVVATVPLGYADGVPWRLGVAGGEVLIGGQRRAIAGSVTMDQITVDCGDDASIVAGDEVVLLGRQGDESVGAWEWASRAGTIAYEILCGIGPRVPKHYVG
ncbi:MAG: alanine racemase [Acidimicrobiales bacterium]